jgi:hypothetical protein
MNPGTFLSGPDYVAAWIRVDRLIHRVVGQRLNQGSTPELDAQFDRHHRAPVARTTVGKLTRPTRSAVPTTSDEPAEESRTQGTPMHDLGVAHLGHELRFKPGNPSFGDALREWRRGSHESVTLQDLGEPLTPK